MLITHLLAVLYGKVDPDPQRLAFLDQVYERGCLNWDTSEGYADSEDLLGKWFARTGKRNEVMETFKALRAES